MILKKITIENFRGFEGSISFNFENKPLVMLTAPNGNGKTSLMDAIEWCITGDIKRLHGAFDRRNTNATEKNANRGAILKHKKHLQDLTRVCIEIIKGDENYKVIRSQNDDTLESKGLLLVNEKEGENAKEELDKIINCENFYKYHYCDMQKTYNFLNKGRGEVEGEFEDFSADYLEVEVITENLINFQGDIKTRISSWNEKMVTEKTQEDYKKTLEECENSSDILIYESKKIYSDEQIDLKSMTVEQLEEALLKLYKCGYKWVLDLLEEKKKSNIAIKRKAELECISKELKMHSAEIEESIKIGAYKKDFREKFETDLQKYNSTLLTLDNLAVNKELIINIGSDNFSNDYWNSSCIILKKITKDKKNLSNEIATLSKGSQIIDILTSITAGKSGLIAYREEMRKKQYKLPVLCPVCGSEQFNKLEETEIAKQAQDYQTENKELIEKKKLELKELKKEEDIILDEQLKNAKFVLDQEIINIKKHVNKLNNLFSTSKKFFVAQQKLEMDNREVYSLKKMISIENVEMEMLKNKECIFTDEKIALTNAGVQRLLNIINYSSYEDLSEGSLLEEIKKRAEDVPPEVMYDENLLISKISAIRSYINSKRFTEATKYLSDAKATNDRINIKIQQLQRLEEKVKERVKDINKKKDELKKEEYKQVGPYLYKIFCKLSRDVKIGDIQLENVKGGKASLLDEEKKSLLNTLSDGQLSVFMLSYFIGNILRMQESEKFPVYFIDDITSCMDDINMLAFLDLIKYQLLKKDTPIKQMFFATCDSRIQNMLKYKMESCGILYKEIGSNDFSALEC